jgi:hypothetical protein
MQPRPINPIGISAGPTATAQIIPVENFATFAIEGMITNVVVK